MRARLRRSTHHGGHAPDVRRDADGRLRQADSGGTIAHAAGGLDAAGPGRASIVVKATDRVSRALLVNVLVDASAGQPRW